MTPGPHSSILPQTAPIRSSGAKSSFQFNAGRRVGKGTRANVLLLRGWTWHGLVALNGIEPTSMVSHATHMVDGSSLPRLCVFQVVSLHEGDRIPAGSRLLCSNGLDPAEDDATAGPTSRRSEMIVVSTKSFSPPPLEPFIPEEQERASLVVGRAL